MLNDQTITITELRSRAQGGEARVGELFGLVAEYERKASHYQDDIHALSDKVTHDICYSSDHLIFFSYHIGSHSNRS